MITTVLKGGLGNQMFQYAIGRTIAELSRDELSLDTSWFNRSSQWPYPFHLDRFDIYDAHSPQSGRTIKEKGYVYNSNIIGIYHEDIILEGYWQDEIYFKDFASLIYKDLQLKDDYKSNRYWIAKDFIKQIDQPVFVHIRRGERVTDISPRAVHGLIDASYYDSAITLVRSMQPTAGFIFFTDDIEYTKSIYGDLGSVIDQMSDYEHLSLMSKCKHAIIANSSFSWWGAWLIENPHKIIIAPDRWTVDQMNSNPNVIPSGWFKLSPKFLDYENKFI